MDMTTNELTLEPTTKVKHHSPKAVCISLTTLIVVGLASQVLFKKMQN